LASVTLAMAVTLAWTRPAAADDDAEARHIAAANYPLVFLAQGDAVVGSDVGAAGDPAAGRSFRLARLRVGEDVSAYLFRLRVVLEARSHGRDGTSYAPIEGGKLADPMRFTDAYLSYVPSAAFHAEVGSLRVPFSLSRQLDEADLPFPERAPIVQALAPDFRVGARAGGDLGAMSYGVAILCASPEIDGRLLDRGAMLALRIAAEPMGPMGATPWRRTAADPWYGWFRFALGVSLLDGSITGLHTTAVGADARAQWRRFVASGEYVLADSAGPVQQGAVVEPGIAWLDGRLFTTARGDWRRAGSVNEWGAGAAVTAYAPDPRVRVQLGFERRISADLATGWAIARLTLLLE